MLESGLFRASVALPLKFAANWSRATLWRERPTRGSAFTSESSAEMEIHTAASGVRARGANCERIRAASGSRRETPPVSYTRYEPPRGKFSKIPAKMRHEFLYPSPDAVGDPENYVSRLDPQINYSIEPHRGVRRSIDRSMTVRAASLDTARFNDHERSINELWIQSRFQF